MIGLQPSREQLEVLGILIDFGVTDEKLLAFWSQVHAREWGFDADPGSDADIDASSMPGHLLTVGMYSICP